MDYVQLLFYWKYNLERKSLFFFQLFITNQQNLLYTVNRFINKLNITNGIFDLIGYLEGIHFNYLILKCAEFMASYCHNYKGLSLSYL